MKKYYDARKEKGLCINCSKKTSGKVRCQTCNEEYRKYQKEEYKRKQALGLIRSVPKGTCQRCRKSTSPNQYRCDECSELHKKEQNWRYHSIKKDPERYKQLQRQTRNTQLIRMFGITLDEYNERVDHQKGVCMICECKSYTNKGTEISLAVDHNHQTGHIRDLLCTRCNTVIGLVNESVDLLNRIKTYIQGHNE